MGRAAEPRLGIAAPQCARRHHERLLRKRGLHIEYRWQILVFDHGESCGTSRLLHRLRDHGEQRLTGILDGVLGEDRIVVHHGAVIVLARNVRRGEHRNDTWRCTHTAQIDSTQPCMCALADADRRMQRALR